MKRFITLVLAAITGSVFTVGISYFMGTSNNDTLRIEHVSSPPVVGATFTLDHKGELVPLEFSEVAEDAMSAVVHIKSIKVYQAKSYQNYYDPFKNFFGDDIFEDFFGKQYRFGYPTPQENKPKTEVGTGSGVIISADGYVVTNNHVINNADDIEVSLHDNRVYKAEVIGVDKSTDLALLKIDENELPAIKMANSDEARIGEWVLAVGNPFNLNSTVTAGIVSAKARNINIMKDKNAIESFIQTDAAINPGNSGGALVNLQGGLIGINTAIATPTGSYAGYGFAVPSNIVSKVVEDLVKYGTVQRGYLGIMIRSVDGILANDKDLDLTEGVYVDSLLENSAAKIAGIKSGDVIISVDNVTTKTSSELLEIIGRHRPGDKVSIIVNREGKEKQFEVTLHNVEGNTSIAKRPENEILNDLGVELVKVDVKTAKKLNIDGGVKIRKIFPGKISRQTNIKEGFIITKIDGKNISEIDDVSKILKDKKGGVLIEGRYENSSRTIYYAFGN